MGGGVGVQGGLAGVGARKNIPAIVRSGLNIVEQENADCSWGNEDKLSIQVVNMGFSTVENVPAPPWVAQRHGCWEPLDDVLQNYSSEVC